MKIQYQISKLNLFLNVSKNDSFRGFGMKEDYDERGINYNYNCKIININYYTNTNYQLRVSMKIKYNSFKDEFFIQT